jgi:hypothetical protein
MMMWFAHGLNNPWMLVSMLIVKVSHAGLEKKIKKSSCLHAELSCCLWLFCFSILSWQFLFIL